MMETRRWYSITTKEGKCLVGPEYGQAVFFLEKDDAESWAKKNVPVEHMVRTVIISPEG